MILEALSLPFFQRVLVAGLLASVACGVLGSYVVAKRMTSMSGGLAHAAFGGIGLGYLLGFPPMLGAAGFGILAGVVIGLGYRRARSSLDTMISMVWAIGMALGIVFVQVAPGYAPDLMSYLFGNLVFVSREYTYLVAALDVVILITVWLLFDYLQAVSFDEEFTEVTGAPVDVLLFGLLALTSLAIVTLIRVVGIILVIALLTIPAAIARQWSDGLLRMMVIATLIAATCTTGGLFLSYALGRVAPGPLIILIAGALFGASSAAAHLRRRAPI